MQGALCAYTLGGNAVLPCCLDKKIVFTTERKIAFAGVPAHLWKRPGGKEGNCPCKTVPSCWQWRSCWKQMEGSRNFIWILSLLAGGNSCLCCLEVAILLRARKGAIPTSSGWWHQCKTSRQANTLYCFHSSLNNPCLSQQTFLISKRNYFYKFSFWWLAEVR